MATTIFPNFNPVLDGKDGQSYSEAGFTKVIYPVINTFIKNQLNNIKQVSDIFIKGKTIINTYICILIGGEGSSVFEPTLEFPDMDATAGGKDGEGITQIQAETQSTYTGNSWNFATIWYMGAKYPLLR